MFPTQMNAETLYVKYVWHLKSKQELKIIYKY